MSLSVVQSVFLFLSELMLAESLQLTVTPEDTPRKDCHTADLVSDKDFICIVCLYYFFAYFCANSPFLERNSFTCLCLLHLANLLCCCFADKLVSCLFKSLYSFIFEQEQA